MSQFASLLLLSLFGLTLTACGGGGGGSSSKPSSAASVQSSSSSPATSSAVSSSNTSSLVSSSSVSSVLVSSSSLSSPQSSAISSSSTSLDSSQPSSSIASSSSSSGGNWEEFGPISGEGAGGAQAVVDEDGHVLVLWKEIDQDLTARSLRYSKFNGNSWTEPQLVENASGEVENFKLVQDPITGQIMVIWKQFASTQYDLWVSVYSTETGWSTPANIETNDGTIGEYDLAIDSQKNAIAVWAQIEVIGRFSIYANRFTPSGGWGTATLIENVGAIGRQDTSPRVVQLSGGDAEVVWMKTGTSPRGIWHNRFTSAGGWGEAEELITDASTDFTFDFPRVVSSGNGIAYLFWGQADFIDSDWVSGLHTKTYASGWNQETKIVGTREASSLISRPFVKLSTTNKGLVVWGGSGESILANTLSNGEAGANTRIKPIDNLDIYSEPVIAVDVMGNGYVTWTQQSVDLAQRHLYLIPYSASTGWKPAVIIGSQDEPAYDSYVAMNGQGTAVLVWTKWIEDQGTKIYARYYRP